MNFSGWEGFALFVVAVLVGLLREIHVARLSREAMTCECGTTETRCVCSGADEDCPALPPEVCAEFVPGANLRCAWCDHGKECHDAEKIARYRREVCARDPVVRLMSETFDS